MLQYLREYPSIFDNALNRDLMNRTFDKPLVEYVKECFLSLQIMKGIEILGFEYTERESEIDVNKYIYKRNKGKKQKEKFKYKYIDDSRCGLLTVRIKLTVSNADPRTNEMVTQEKIITKSILIPLEDEEGRYYLKGEYVYLIFQLVEKSTYTAFNSVILKSLMPFAVKRFTINVTDTEGTDYVLPYYTIQLFYKDIEVMLMYATRGLNYALQFALDTPYLVMDFVTEVKENDLENIYFPISATLFLRVNRELFEGFTYVQSVVGGILQITTNRLTIDKLDDTEIWLKKLGQGNVKKGLNLMDSAKRLLDETTGKVLKLDIYNKHDVLSLVRWMMEEYNDLRMKDNVDLANKRVRRNEIFSCLLTLEFSMKLNRLMGLGGKATMDNYREVFSFPGDIMIQEIHASGIGRYNDIINDMDFFSKFKWTIKGPQSLGNKNSNNIGVLYRGIHPSFLGRIDLTVCGNSDRLGRAIA